MTIRALRSVAAIASVFLSAPNARAQQLAKIPIHQVEVLATTDSGAFLNLTVMRPLSDGRVLFVDAVTRQLNLFDASLKHMTVLADTARKAPTRFGAGIGGLLPFPGDSTAFVDQDARVLIVVSPEGKFGNVIAPPNANDVASFAIRDYGNPGFDSKGRLYYRTRVDGSLPGGGTMPSHDTTFVFPDSVGVVRADLNTRAIDTIAKISIQTNKSRFMWSNGRPGMIQIINPLPMIDDWAFDIDGTLAVIRAHDYHIDWLLPDGSKKSTQKMPFDWRRISLDEKKMIVDSMQHQFDSAHDATVERLAARAKESGMAPAPVFPGNKAAAADELPDYYPPIKLGARSRFDLDGNLWVMPATSNSAVGGGLLYDVINRKGEIIERVQMPPGCRLNGFGAGGIIYLLQTFPVEPSRIQRAKILR